MRTRWKEHFKSFVNFLFLEKLTDKEVLREFRADRRPKIIMLLSAHLFMKCGDIGMVMTPYYMNEYREKYPGL